MCFNNNEPASEVDTERLQQQQQVAFVSSEEDESQVGNANTLLQNSQQQQQQQPLGPVVNWERYLPVRSLKVLLVENDDSTRHIVTALLKNCSYEVIAVSDVLEAWSILEDENSCIDLVLTEVVMPVNSGTDLLSKITSHTTLKSIPVIMMSSHDSMALVFNCLSNGAVDFLVKPIRKNELKNLWQHVWRKCHSSSGSGSESGIHNKKSVKTESTEDSENDADISDEDRENENGSNNGGSDNGSGTQSSWTKRASDMNPIDEKEHVNKPKDAEAQTEQIGTGSQGGMCKSKKAEEPRNLEKDTVQDLERNNDDMLIHSYSNSQAKSKTPSSNGDDLQSHELTLMTKLREAGDYRTADRSVLRQSNHSAFSKYNNNGATSANKAPEENVGSCSPQDSSVAKIMGSSSGSDKNPLNQHSSGSSGEKAARREAALMKFRLKRKDRCFEKKVRYHSRKKLAEQRPRVKGQFIRKRDDSKSDNDCPSSEDS